MGFDELEPVFGRLNAEWSAPHKTPLKPFLFHVHGLSTDPSTLCVCATDFHSNTWHALKSAQELEDMRDRTGIGGSWSDFVDYLIAAVKSEDVKLVMDGQSKVGGAAHAKLVAQKAKGMPRIAISLSKLVDTAATEAMANLSLALYTTFTNLLKVTLHEVVELTITTLAWIRLSKSPFCTYSKEKQRCCELTNVLSDEKMKGVSSIRILCVVLTALGGKKPDCSIRLAVLYNSPSHQKHTDMSSHLAHHHSIYQEKNEIAQKQLDALLYSKRQKFEKTASDTATISSSLVSPVKQAAQLPSTKVTNRVVPAHRRARVRGVLLHDTEEERQD
uniref:Uncharacterized protein n=1 Tax=Solanum lycopersicum TaxID=4081 RepID=A0A3Q7ERA0_SOLLC